MPTTHPLIGDPDGECLLTCPYNSSHRVAAKRIQFHLTKCRKSYPNAKKETCPFNSTHMVNEQEFLFHLEVCPNKGVVDNFKYVTPNDDHVINTLPETVVPETTENWDDDYCGTYEPFKKVAAAPIIHSFIGGTKSERKKCRLAERQKFRTLEETTPMTKVTIKETSLLDDQPLRQPRTFPQSMAQNQESSSLNQSFASQASEVTRHSLPRGLPEMVKALDDQPLRQPRTLPKSMAKSSNLTPVNQSLVSQLSEAVKSTRLNGQSDSTNRCRNTTSFLEGVAQNNAGPSEVDDDGFAVFITRGRGKLRH